jgi:hypothetical protein
LVRAVKHSIILIAVIVSFAACEKAPTILGDAKSDEFKVLSLPVIRRNLVDLHNTPVTIEGRYLSSLPEGAAGEKDAIAIKTEFGDAIITFPMGKYEPLLAKLRKDDRVKAFGYVSTITPPGKTKVLLAIDVR